MVQINSASFHILCSKSCNWASTKGIYLPTLSFFVIKLKLIYRYLEGYEKLYFLGEDDDSSTPRLGLYNLGSYGSQQTPQMFIRGIKNCPYLSEICWWVSSTRFFKFLFVSDPPRNFDRLVLSLQSGIPNEVDFAINICMLLSNVNNSVFNLTKVQF